MLQSDAGPTADKRLRVLVAQLREMLAEPNTEVLWADTKVMLVDCLTKLGPEKQYLLDALHSGVWTPASTEACLEAKARLREQRKARKAQKKAESAAPA